MQSSQKFNNIIDPNVKLTKHCVIPLERWLIEDKTLLHQLDVGIYLRISDEVNLLVGQLTNTSLIIVDFCDFEDGRAYSQIRILRTICHYTKEILALNAHLDQLQLMQRCGVNFFKLSTEYNKKAIEDYLKINDICYQSAYNNIGLVEKF